MSLVLFDQTLQVTRIIGSENIIEDTQVAERDGLITHTVEVCYDPAMDTCVYFGERDPIDRENFWLYRITKREKSGHTMTLDGMHKFFDDLKAYGYIKEKRPNNVGFDVMIDPVLSGTGWTIGEHSVTGRGSQSFYYTSRLDAFWKTMEAFHVEFKLHCSFENGKITSQVIDFADTYDEDHGRIYVYGDKLLKVEAQTDDAEVFTAFVGRGKGVQKESENPEQESPGYSRKITFADVEWTSGSNPPIHKPKGQEYIEIPEATARYGYPDGSPRIGFVEFDDIEDPLVLVEATYLYALEHSHPQVQFKADVYEPEHVSLYEVVGIKDRHLGILYKTRVFKVTRSFLNPAQQTIEFGTQLIEDEGRAEARAKRSEEAKKIAENELFNQRMVTLVDAYGNHVYHGSLTPQNPVLGDIWFRENPDGTVDILVWDGTQWSVELNEKMFSDLRKKVDEAEAEAQAAVESAQAFIQQVDDDIAKAGFSSLEEGLTAIQDDAKTALQKASDENIKKVIATENYVTEGEINTKLSSLDVSGEVSEYLQNNEVVTPERFKRLLSETEIDDNGNTVTGQLASIEMMATGIQTVVSDLNDDMSSRITQLNNAIQTKVSSSEMESRITQAADQIDMSVSRTVENELAKIPQGAKVCPYNEPISPIDAMSKRMDEALPVDFTSERPNITIYQAQVGSACGRQDALQKMAESMVFPNTQIKGTDGFIKYEAKGYLEYYREVASKVEELTGADVIVCTRVSGDSTYPRSWYDALCYVEQAVSFEGGTLTRHSEPGTKGKSWSAWSLPNGDENIISRINLTAGGPVLSSGDNRLFVSPETTFIDDATIGSAHIKNASIGTAKISQIDAGNQRVVNITAANLAADKASFIEALFNGYYSNIKITGDKIQFYPNAVGDDAFSITINRKNIGFWLPDNNGRIGVITNTANPNDGLLMATTSQYYRLMLGYPDVNSYSYQQYGANDVGNYLYAISIHGRSGRITMHTAVTFNSGYTNNGSDIRLKEDIQTWDISAIQAIKDIQFIRFKYKKRQDDQKNEVYPVMYGLSAQSAPFISYERDDGYLTLDLEREQHLALKGVQELIEENEILKARVTSLEQRLEMMEEHLAKLEGGVLWK